MDDIELKLDQLIEMYVIDRRVQAAREPAPGEPAAGWAADAPAGPAGPLLRGARHEMEPPAVGQAPRQLE